MLPRRCRTFAPAPGLSRATATPGWCAILGSKNGTFVNGVRITSPFPLGKNDRITAGHIALDFGENSLPPPPTNTVIFIEGLTPTTSVSTTVATSLKGVLSQDKEIEGDPQMRALIRAGRELAGNMPLAELFKLIMNLSVEAVGATRGVLMTLEGEGAGGARRRWAKASASATRCATASSRKRLRCWFATRAWMKRSPTA